VIGDHLKKQADGFSIVRQERQQKPRLIVQLRAPVVRWRQFLETRCGKLTSGYGKRRLAPRSTDNLYLPVEIIRNIRHRRLLLLNQDETLSSAVNAKGGYPMGRKRRLRDMKPRSRSSALENRPGRRSR
jgi:hypothetical protein